MRLAAAILAGVILASSPAAAEAKHKRAKTYFVIKAKHKHRKHGWLVGTAMDAGGWIPNHYTGPGNGCFVDPAGNCT